MNYKTLITISEKIMTTFNLLMIDDDKEDIFVIRRALRRSKLPIYYYSIQDSGEFIDKIKIETIKIPDLILLDINMPKFSGYNILSHLRGLETWSKVPIWMLTTSSLKADRNKCLSLGANDFLVKPTSAEQLKDLINKVSQLVLSR